MSTKSYGSRARSAVVWNLGGNLFRDVLQFGQMLILSRLLAEEAYGQFAFVTSVTGLVMVFSAAPFLTYTLQVKSDEDTHYQDQFTAGGVLQGGCFLITNLVAFALAYFPKYAAAEPYLHAASFTFLIEWPCELRRKMIERDCDFRSLRLLHSVGLGLSTATAIGLALAGLGTYSLVVPAILTALPFIWDLFFRLRWRPTWQFSWAQYRPAFRFGLTRIGSGLSDKGRTMLEASYLVAAIGFGPLGILNRANGLAVLACGRLAPQLMYSIYPLLTRLEEQNNRVERAGNLVIRLIAWVGIPIACILGIAATPIVNVIYGPHWSEVAPLLRWTLISALAASLVYTLNSLLLARGSASFCVVSDLFNLAGTALALFLATPFGIVPYLATIIGVHTLNFVILSSALVRAGGVSVRGLIEAIGPALLSSATGFVAVMLVSQEYFVTSESLVSVIAYCALFAAGYVLVLRCLFSASLLELIAFLPAGIWIRRALCLSGT